MNFAAPHDSVQGSQLLSRIALLRVDEIDQFVRDNPGAIAALIGKPPQARDVVVWWSTMPSDARNELRAASPELVGNLVGIPYQIRDLANRSVLSSTMSELESTISTQLGRASTEKARLQLAMLQSISNALGSNAVGPNTTIQDARAANTPTAGQWAQPGAAKRSLLSLDVTGQGKAAIAVGNLNDADYVTYMVPGMFFTIEGQMVYWTDAAARLRDEQLSWLALYGDTTSTVATVAWIGYHTPNLTNVGSLENAEEARDSLARSIEGLQTLRAGHEPYITVIGHSYGSTAALMALTEYDFEVDAL
ncbi:MAG: alpha/beta hydrolase, partial [Rhodoglobus sp.]|nr:alpha/beta hydrolase [Rhodoglobus sp.]